MSSRTSSTAGSWRRRRWRPDRRAEPGARHGHLGDSRHARGDGRRGRGLGQAGAGRVGEAAGDRARGLPAPDLGQDPRQCRADRARDLRGAGQGPGPRPGRGRVHGRLHRLHGRVGAPDRGRDHPERPAGREHLPVPPADRRDRRHPALELPVLPDRAQAGAGADHRQHDRDQAVARRRPTTRRCSRSWSPRPSCRRASSTWSTAAAAPRAAR